MSSVVPDALKNAVKKVSRAKKVDWKSFGLRGEAWDVVSKIMIKTLDEMRGDGVNKPLSVIQELAFKKSLKFDASKDKSSHPLHTVALWLTDTRIWVEEYTRNKENHMAYEILVRRGIIKKKRGGD